jgi:hypothetical protein
MFIKKCVHFAGSWYNYIMNKQNVIGPYYDTKHFTWIGESNYFVAEISTVPAVLRQLWNDSLDLGFCMISHKTGNEAFFTLIAGERDDDGDYVFWLFKPTQSSIDANPRLKDVFVKIFNT